METERLRHLILVHFYCTYGCKSVHLQVNLGSAKSVLMDAEKPGTHGKYIFINSCSLLEPEWLPHVY